MRIQIHITGLNYLPEGKIALLYQQAPETAQK